MPVARLKSKVQAKDALILAWEIVKRRACLPKLAGRNCILATVAVCLLAGAAWASPWAGIAMHGAPKYASAPPHLNYVNPDAPKGGEPRLGVLGSFDSLIRSIQGGEPVACQRRRWADRHGAGTAPDADFTNGVH
jgi:ABC-type oligopeptide transport system substrate-binding subunit